MRIADIPPDHAVLVVANEGTCAEDMDTVRRVLSDAGVHGALISHDFARQIMTFPIKSDVEDKVQAIMAVLEGKERLKKGLRQALVQDWFMEPSNTEHLEDP